MRCYRESVMVEADTYTVVCEWICEEQGEKRYAKVPFAVIPALMERVLMLLLRTSFEL